MCLSKPPSVDPPKPPPPAEDPGPSDEEKARLARQRKSMDARRTGRSSLVIGRKNPGVSAKAGSGLRIGGDS